MPIVTAVVDILDTTLTHDPVPGALVRVFDATGTTFITDGVTDALGVFSFDANAGDPPIRYQLRCSKIGVSFANPEYVDLWSPLPPLTANHFVIYGDIHEIQPALNPLMCRAEGFLLDPGARPLKDLIVRFTNLFEPVILNGVGLLHKLEVRTDARGWASAELPRDGHYVATVSGLQDERLEIRVPDRPGVSLIDLLWPVVAQVTFSPAAPWSVPMGGTLDVVPTVTASSYFVLTGPAGEDLLYETSDPLIASIETMLDKLVIHGVAVGSTDMVITRKDSSIHRIPDVPLVGTGGLITVA